METDGVGTDRSARGPGRSAAAGALVLLLLAAGVSAVLDGTTDRPEAETGCRTVAFISMTGAAPECP
ncbi:hypothetical protein [Streptomyces sp. NPDC051567]|uniref:hypothetical protein n=1 Tax=Streptomyces sp. NPDC051567 TaxID=3365660 RepID=UPI0037B822AF